MITTLNKENFKKEVLEETKPVLVDFYATWCPPCQALHPIFETLAEKHQEKIKFGRLDIGEAEEVASQYGVMSVPTMIFFKGGQEIKRITGLISQDAIEKHLNVL
jgi:thioredoxin 1